MCAYVYRLMRIYYCRLNVSTKELVLTHWGRVTHICVGKLSIIGSDNGLSPSRRQAIIWTNAGILLIGTLGTNFSEISIEIYTFSFKKMILKMSSGKWPSCLGLNVLSYYSVMWCLWNDYDQSYMCTLHFFCDFVSQWLLLWMTDVQGNN